MAAYIVGIIGCLLILAGIVELLRRRQLTEKYAILWLVIGLIVLVLTALGPNLLLVLTHALGFAVPANLLFFLAIVFLICVSLHLSWELSRSENETRKIAEELAILRLDFEELKAELEKKQAS